MPNPNPGMEALFRSLGPKTARPLLGLTPTGVVPGTYTNATVTVDENGVISFADNGSSSGGTSEYTQIIPAISDVSALLHYNDADHSTSTVDVIGNTWTFNGAAEITAADAVFGIGCLYVPAGSNSCIRTPMNSGFDFGAGDFAFQTKIKVMGSPETSARLWHMANGDVATGITLYIGTSGPGTILLQMWDGGTYFINELIGTVPVTGTHDLLLQRCDGMLTFFIDGFQVFKKSAPNALYYNSGYTMCLGGQSTGTSRSANVKLDETRICKGTAIMIPNAQYTVETSEFPDT